MLQDQNEEHLFLLNDDLLNQEIYQDYLINEEENMHHQKLETNLWNKNSTVEINELFFMYHVLFLA